MITIEQRQILTEWLGECWHEWEIAYPPLQNGADENFVGHRCKKCSEYWPTKIEDGYGSRTFTTWKDFGAILLKLKKKQAIQLMEMAFDGVPEAEQKQRVPERFCILVAEALKMIRHWEFLGTTVATGCWSNTLGTYLSVSATLPTNAKNIRLTYEVEE